MSKSRLEKFLYALYSLDSSDLPTPLSRIEELYNCWVTGEEAPIFKPLSRVEKYLMAILGVYDVNELPNPLSRVEVLLYKLATGDDNLDDVKSFLSEHEELLAEIIRNGGVGGNIDIEYVLYTLLTEFNTLYNTAKKPVKSAILKGNTMKNIIGDEIFMDAGTSSITNITDLRKNYLIPTVKISTNYLVMYELEGDKIEGADASNLVTAIGFLNHNGGWSSNFEQQPLKGKLIINSGDYPNYFRVVLNNKGYSKLKSVKINVIEYEEYMNDFDIPYFEGMQSVKMPVLTTVGKNQWIEQYFTKHNSNSSILTNTNNGFIVEHPHEISEFIKTYINLKKGTWTISFDVEKTDTSSAWVFLQKGDVYGENIAQNVSIRNGRCSITYTSSSDIENACFFFDLRHQGMLTISNIQLEENSTTTSFEPFKTNILTVNEEVELRGIGEVKDELNLLTGELTQRVGEVVLDGSENWIKSMNTTKLPYRFICENLLNHSNYQEICDSFKTGRSFWSVDTTGLYIGANHKLVITFKSDDDRNNYTVAEFKQYLSENPITVQYHLRTESVKTVDLSIVDQDGGDTKLSTFNDITHVTLSSEGLIPEAELEVATKNEEVLNTMSLEMDDISATQATLEETSITQSENVDATMIATTEIYEGLL